MLLVVYSDTLEIRVPGLLPLGEGDNYVLVGGTSGHTGPGVFSGYMMPDNNHYGVPSVLDSLASFADTWASVVVEDIAEPDDQTPLYYNDISLPSGGMFDVCGNWHSPHTFHRVGRDIDIRTTRWLPSTDTDYPHSREGVYLTPFTDELGKESHVNVLFEAEMLALGASNIKPHGRPKISDETGLLSNGDEHYHVYFFSRTEDDE